MQTTTKHLVKQRFFLLSTVFLLLLLVASHPAQAQEIPGAQNSTPAPLPSPEPNLVPNVPPSQSPAPSGFAEQFKHFFFDEDQENLNEHEAPGDDSDIGGGCSLSEEQLDQLMKQYMI